MSLDVYLSLPTAVVVPTGEGRIFIREEGRTREISRDDWDQRFPDREPVVAFDDSGGESHTVYSANITHNLNKMADAAGIYRELWQPDEMGITTAAALIGPLTDGLDRLRTEPDKFRAFNPENGWGDYEGLMNFVEEYRDACVSYPEAQVRVSR